MTKKMNGGMKKMNGDVWKELEERLKQKAKTAWRIHYNVNFSFKPIEYFKNETWVRLEDVKKELQRLKQRVCEVIDQYIKAYPLDTPEDRQVSKVLDEIRQELLKE